MSGDLKQPLLNKSISLQTTQKIELSYKVSVQAHIKKQVKLILDQQQAVIHPGTFTAIMGPSGSGKTTLLNFLSGRLTSDALKYDGEYRINGEEIKSMKKYANNLGYVMQEDLLLGTMTPWESFKFAADLKREQSESEKIQIVNNYIKQLGLEECANTKIGSAIIKGISGGEKKRTSIGIELITNPSIILLDQPTTGLDSTTALQVILLLKKLSVKGKTVISTIHQPSSMIVQEFDKLMLLSEGKQIYHGDFSLAIPYFEKLGYSCPSEMNASEFFLEIVGFSEQTKGEETLEEIRSEHQKKIQKLADSYLSYKAQQKQIKNQLSPLEKRNPPDFSPFYAIWVILIRSLKTILRNPMDVGLKIIQTIFVFAVLVLVYGKIHNDDPEAYQNIRGIIFFVAVTNSFGGIQGTLATFASERAIFIRERYSRTYSLVPYFLGRTLANQPFNLIYPTVFAAMVYWACSVGNGTAQEMGRLMLVANANYFCAVGIGLFYASFLKNLATAMALVPLLIIPFLIMGGFFINLSDIHDLRVIFYPIIYISPFRYGFQGGMYAIHLIKQNFKPDSFEMNCVILLGIGVVARILAIFGMYKASTPKEIKFAKKGQ